MNYQLARVETKTDFFSFSQNAKILAKMSKLLVFAKVFVFTKVSWKCMPKNRDEIVSKLASTKNYSYCQNLRISFYFSEIIFKEYRFRITFRYFRNLSYTFSRKEENNSRNFIENTKTKNFRFSPTGIRLAS
jgi:predicted solute-binding protein